MLVPLHHFSCGGFKVDFATVVGKPTALEVWTIAEVWRYQDVINAMRDSVIDGLTSLKKFDGIPNLDEYSAVSIPGDHGP